MYAGYSITLDEIYDKDYYGIGKKIAKKQQHVQKQKIIDIKEKTKNLLCAENVDMDALAELCSPYEKRCLIFSSLTHIMT